LPDNLFKSEVLSRLSTVMFNTAVTEQNKGNWAQSYKILHDCNRYIEEGLDISTGYVKEDLKELKERKFIHICIAECIKNTVAADSLYQAHLESKNLDMMWQIADMYKEAALLTREKDMESEAIALSRLGRLFDKVFLVRTKAHEYYRQALDLAMALKPRDLSQTAWYIECQDALQRFQQEILDEEAKNEAATNNPILEELKEVINGFKDIKEPKDLIIYLYKNHPPKDAACTLESVDMTDMKKALIKVIVHYHPDKQAAYAEDKKWVVLCGEITKVLNNLYSILKSQFPKKT